MARELLDASAFFDLGHRGDADYTQIERLLMLTPTERLDRHEGWRLFLKEALGRAAVRQRDDSSVGGSPS